MTVLNPQGKGEHRIGRGGSALGHIAPNARKWWPAGKVPIDCACCERRLFVGGHVEPR